MSKRKFHNIEMDPASSGEEGGPQYLFMPPPQQPQDEPKFRKIGLIGDVNEDRSSDIIYGLYALRETGKTIEEPKTKRGKPKEVYEPIELLVSTNGGSASDMFAIYDVIRDIRKDCPVHTFGLGKVMSAGVLLLASGTKGQRRIGKNCRVMIHSVIAGNSGPVHNLQNEMAEVLETQKRYIDALKSETKLTDKQIKSFFDRHVDIYLSAAEAVKYGIADVVV
jgi:ATP-dependent Clp endopeptidase proteolytic subunit ClpP